MKPLTLPEIERLEACDRNCAPAPWSAFVADDSEYGTYAVLNYKDQEIITWGGFDGVRAPEAASKEKRRAHVRMISFVRNLLPRVTAQLRADACRIAQLETELAEAQPLPPVEEGVPSGSGWLPIESAPRDATILIAVERANGLPMRLGSQHMVYPAYVDDDGRFCNSGDWEPSTGFSGHFRPTHWMPLPPAPGEAPTPSPSKERVEKLEAALMAGWAAGEVAADLLHCHDEDRAAADLADFNKTASALLETEGK